MKRIDPVLITGRLERGTLLRQEWGDGFERACLLAAIVPETAVAARASVCPADVMPPWLAHLTPWMDDSGSLSAWPGMVRRYAAVAARWWVLTVEDWARVGDEVRIGFIEEVLSFVDTNDDIQQVCAQVVGALRGEGSRVDALEAAERLVGRVENDEFYVAAAAEWAARTGPRSIMNTAEQVAIAAMHRGQQGAIDRLAARVLSLIEAACEQAEKSQQNNV